MAQTESKRFFSDMIFSSKSCFSKIEFKTCFFEFSFSLKYDYSKSFVFEIFPDDKFSIQNLTCWKTFNWKSHFLGINLLHNLIIFFKSIPYQTLIYNEKGCFKIMPFEISTKTEKNCCSLRNKLSHIDFIEMWIFHQNLISE